MGKTHEALKRAEDQYKEHQIRVTKEPFQKEFGNTQGRASVRKYMEPYGGFKNDLFAQNSDRSIKSVLFIKAFKGEESTDHAIKFATSLVSVHPRIQKVDDPPSTIG